MKVTNGQVMYNFLTRGGFEELYENRNSSLRCTGAWLVAKIEGMYKPLGYITEEDIVLVYNPKSKGKHYLYANALKNKAFSRGQKVLEVRSDSIFDEVMKVQTSDLDETISKLFVEFSNKTTYGVITTDATQEFIALASL